MTQGDRRVGVDGRKPIPQDFAQSVNGGSRAAAWNPASRIAVMLMLGVLAGADIWIFTMAKISSLPSLRVHIGTVKLGLAWLSSLVS
ncbi:MAG: hypothetical protein HY661_00095 [Betaproteobacteria bacterium]|nr:hypothetical protein [Betaproteobacteria bacterium]